MRSENGIDDGAVLADHSVNHRRARAIHGNDCETNCRTSCAKVAGAHMKEEELYQSRVPLFVWNGDARKNVVETALIFRMRSVCGFGHCARQ